MDPGLARLIEAGDPADEVAVLVRFSVPRPALPAGVRVVASFGDVATVRVARGGLERLRSHTRIRSVKAAHGVHADVEPLPDPTPNTQAIELPDERNLRRPNGIGLTGRGVVVGVVDWGLDFTHPTFRNPDGSTRLLALWDQQPGPDPCLPNRYGYGRIHDRTAIDTALTAADPAAALGYFYWLSDIGGGTHGTATTSIAAGSGWPGGLPGVAPDADIVFVHLSTWGPEGPQGLGDSVALAEAFDFIRTVASDNACVINCSLGGHCGPHDGSSLLEQAMDAFVLERPGRMLAQSCGNYFGSDTHTEQQLFPGDHALLPIDIDAGMIEGHEIDVWYSGADRMTIGIIAPGGHPRVLTRPGQHRDLAVDGSVVAEIRHRVDDPNDGRNQALIRLGPGAQTGTWHVAIQAADVVDGRFHAWIEREPVPPSAQPRFPPEVAVGTTSTGTICNGFRPLSVGAYNAHDPTRLVSSFSSSGPTVDGRRKPDLIAPGSHVQVARSRPADLGPNESPQYTFMSGTSMAAPHVTGAVACLFEAAARPASAVRATLLENCDPYRGDEPTRAGNGYLNLAAAVESLAAAPAAPFGSRQLQPRATEGEFSQPHDIHPLEQLDRDRSGTEAVVTDTQLNRVGVLTETAFDVNQQAGSSPVPENVEDVLSGLAATPHELFDAYVADRNPTVRDRLADKLDLLYGPHDRVENGLRARDLLVRAAIGEGQAMVALLVEGELLTHREAEKRDWELEGSLPGRYALVIEGAPRVRGPEDRWARRITDQRGNVPAGQALLRLRIPAATPASVGDARAAGLAEDAPDAVALHSARFSGDTVLAAVAAGRLRLAAPGTAPYPAPVSSSGPALVKVQQALIDLGYPLPTFGPDGRFGGETGRAVARYKTDRGITPSDPVVGPQTIHRLDGDIAAHDPLIAPPVLLPPSPNADTTAARWVEVMGVGMRAGNDVEPLIDGLETFAAMLRAIRTATSRGHYIYLLGWWLDLTVPLDPAATPGFCGTAGASATPRPSALRSLLSAAASSNVQIRVMLWDQTGSSQNTPEVGFVNSLTTGAAMLDNNQLNYWSGSQHQKVLIVNGSEGLTAFCGGVDINADRICARTVGSASGGSASPAGAGDPLHDVHCRITGPAADDLLETFVKRWYANPQHRSLDRAKGPLLGLCQAPATTAGTAAVRIGETFNATFAMPVRPVTDCRVPPPEQPIRVFRDRGGQQVYLTAIEHARRFIYWEDQYLVNMCAAEALRRALPNVNFIILLIADSRISDLPQRWYRRKRFIQHIRSHPQGGKLRVFTLCDPATGGIGPHTYVHAKTMMVDDELAIVGSANCNRRGWESDTEVVAAIAGGADASGRTFAKRLRQRLWMEHLGVAGAAVDDAVASAPLWWLPSAGPSRSVTLPHGAVLQLPGRRVNPYDVNGGTDRPPQALAPWDTVDPLAPAPSAPCNRIWVPAEVPESIQSQQLVSIPIGADPRTDNRRYSTDAELRVPSEPIPRHQREAPTGAVLVATGDPGGQIEARSTEEAQMLVAPAGQGVGPIRTVSGFIDVVGDLIREPDLRAAVVNAVEGEHLKWNTAAGGKIKEDVPTQLPHLVSYSLGGQTSRIPPSTLLALQSVATDGTINYGNVPTYGATDAAIRAWARGVRPAFVGAAPGASPPVSLGALVEQALVFAIKCALEEDPPPRPPPAADLTTYFWSAVFVTDCVRRAAIGLNLEADSRGLHEGRDVLLLATEAHRWYVLEAYRARFGPAARDGTYHAFEPHERSVQDGDVIIQDRTPRLDLGHVYRFSRIPGIGAGRSLHGDVVVAVNQRAGYAETIGGNVGDSVTRRRYPLDAAGKLVVARAQLHTQEDNACTFPAAFPGVGNHHGVLQSSSTARIFALLSPVEQRVAVLGQRVDGGVLA